MISESLDPWRIFSLTWFLRSSASGAFESARVWFWHTRQRSSEASVMTLCSSAGSAAAGAASFANAHGAIAARNTNGRTLSTAELLHQGQYLVLDDLRRERADALVADDPELVDHVGLGHSVDAVVDPDPAVEVEGGELVGVAHALQPRQAVLALVLVVEPVDRHDAACGELEQHGVLLAAGDAPGGPDVEDPDLAEHVALGKRLLRLLQQWQFEVRRGLADERRGYLAWIEREPDGEQRDQRHEDGQGKNEAVHGCFPKGVTIARPAPRRTAPGASPPACSGGRLRQARRPAPSTGTRPISSR